MKKLIVLAVAALGLYSCQQPAKIGFVDNTELVNEYQEKKDFVSTPEYNLYNSIAKRRLSNFKSVEEVLQNISSLGIDGWNWHFFVADKQGKSAGIEFVNGTTYINTESNMPIPLMGNGRYSEDLSFLKEFEGFGGHLKIDENDSNLPGFVKAAKMINTDDDKGNLVDYGFDILGKSFSRISFKYNSNVLCSGDFA